MQGGRSSGIPKCSFDLDWEVLRAVRAPIVNRVTLTLTIRGRSFRRLASATPWAALEGPMAETVRATHWLTSFSTDCWSQSIGRT